MRIAWRVFSILVVVAIAATSAKDARSEESRRQSLIDGHAPNEVGDFDRGTEVPSGFQSPGQFIQPFKPGNGTSVSAESKDDPDVGLEMAKKWELWHRRVAEAVFLRFDMLATQAFTHSRPLSCRAAEFDRIGVRIPIPASLCTLLRIPVKSAP